MSRNTKNRLAKYGHKFSSWDLIIEDLMDHADRCDRFWEDRL